MMEGFDLINLVLKILPWCASFISYFVGIRQERRKNRRGLILDCYRPLAADLRLSLPDITNRFIQGYQEHGNYLEVLVDMSNDSTLKIIEGLDKKLHDDLKSILDNFIPAEKELDARKDESWKEIPRKWQKWVEDNYYEFPSQLRITPEEFVEKLSISLLWALWRHDEQLAVQNFRKTWLEHFYFGDEKERIYDSETRLNQLKNIAEEEWKPIRDGYEKLRKYLHDLIELKILPRMDETLKELGE